MPVTESGLIFAESYNSRAERMRAWKTRADEQASQLQRELKELDPLLEVDFVDPAAASLPPSERAANVVPGRWHIIRKGQDGHADSWFPICGANGSYRDPELKIVEEMKQADLWRPGALNELEDSFYREQKDNERADALAAEQREDELALSLRAARRVKGDGGLTKRTDKK